MNTRSAGVWLSYSLLVLACGTVRTAEKPAAKPPEVPVALPIVREVTDYEDFTGRTEAQSRVDLRARVTGYLLKAPFREGAEVKEGDLLFEIDPRPYQAELDRAEAAIRLAEAQLKLTEAVLQRAKALFAQKATGPDEIDKAVAARAEAEARVRAAKASLESARLNLDFTRVRAPIAGRIGRRLLDPGNLVKADETILATVVSRDPMYVYFEVDERTLLHLRRSMREGKEKPEKMPVFIGLAGDEGHPLRGVVDFTDNQVNAETGTIRMRTVLPNKDDLLVPGLFVRVRLALGASYKALLVPAEAVLADNGVQIVYVVNDKGVIESRTVETGRGRDALRIVNRGLKPEDRVIIGRQQRLRPGMTVRPVDVKTPSAPPAPAKRETDARPVRGEPGPVVLVETEYPGANAAVVADTVAAPVEQQVRGVEKALSLRSRCTNDGKYTLAVTFARGADPKISQVLVQNRVYLALPVLPDAVKRTGVTTRERAPDVRMIVTLFSPDDSRDSLYLSNYASIQIKDELASVAGVADVCLVGASDYSLRVWLDPEKLAARNLTAAEVVRALENQNVQAAAGRTPKGKKRQTEITVKSTGRLIDPETLAEVILKTDAEARVVRLKDVARIELGAERRESHVSLNGRSAVALVLHTSWQARPRELSAALREKVSDLLSRFPPGLDLTLTFDAASDRPATPEYLLLDLDLPLSASTERIQKTLGSCETLLRHVQGVQHALALTDNPFDLFGSGPCIVVALAPAKTRKVARGEIMRSIRSRLEEIKEMTLRLRDLSGPGRFPRCAYPIDLAVRGPELVPVRDFAKKLAERLGDSKELADVSVSPDSLPRPQLVVEVDRARSAALAVSAQDITNTLQVYAGTLHVNDFNRFGRTWRVEIQAKADSDDWMKDIKKLQLRNARGQMVSLGALVSTCMTDGPQALDFLDSRPMVDITANAAPGASLEKVRALCAKLAEEVRTELRLSAEYGMSWLQEMPTSK